LANNNRLSPRVAGYNKTPLASKDDDEDGIKKKLREKVKNFRSKELFVKEQCTKFSKHQKQQQQQHQRK
jgi:hypothetical protein